MKTVIVLLSIWLTSFSLRFPIDIPPKKEAQPQDYVITQFGASTDSTKLATQAIQQRVPVVGGLL